MKAHKRHLIAILITIFNCWIVSNIQAIKIKVMSGNNKGTVINLPIDLGLTTVGEVISEISLLNRQYIEEIPANIVLICKLNDKTVRLRNSYESNCIFDEIGGFTNESEFAAYRAADQEIQTLPEFPKADCCDNLIAFYQYYEHNTNRLSALEWLFRSCCSDNEKVEEDVQRILKLTNYTIKKGFLIESSSEQLRGQLRLYYSIIKKYNLKTLHRLLKAVAQRIKETPDNTRQRLFFEFFTINAESRRRALASKIAVFYRSNNEIIVQEEKYEDG